MLLKVALIVGCEFIENITFEELCPLTLVKEEGSNEKNENYDNHRIGSCSSSTQKRKLSTANMDEQLGDRRSSDNNLHRLKHINDHDSVSLEDNSRSSSERYASSSCDCCCHLHQGKSGRNFWRHISKNYIGSYAHFSLTSPTSASSTNCSSVYNNPELLLEKLNTYSFDILIGGDGRRNTLSDNFRRKEFRGKLAIAITANFINNHTLAEAQIPEISGISFIYHQEMFK